MATVVFIVILNGNVRIAAKGAGPAAGEWLPFAKQRFHDLELLDSLLQDCSRYTNWLHRSWVSTLPVAVAKTSLGPGLVRITLAELILADLSHISIRNDPLGTWEQLFESSYGLFRHWP